MICSHLLFAEKWFFDYLIFNYLKLLNQWGDEGKRLSANSLHNH